MKHDPIEIIASYKAAYRAANPRAPLPEVTYAHGWYTIRQTMPTKYRIHAIQRMTKTLLERAAAA